MAAAPRRVDRGLRSHGANPVRIPRPVERAQSKNAPPGDLGEAADASTLESGATRLYDGHVDSFEWPCLLVPFGFGRTRSLTRGSGFSPQVAGESEDYRVKRRTPRGDESVSVPADSLALVSPDRSVV